MATSHRAVLTATMSLALAFGFFHLAVPASLYDFERLHVFLFNLCSGGAVLIYFTEGRSEVGLRVLVYFLLSLLYAVSAFFYWYAITLTLSVPLLLLVESTRIRRFSLFPVDLFRSSVPASQKFHQAAILCLSLAIVFAALVITNNEYTHSVSLPRLSLDMFFLGDSFPVSLITFSVMFSLMTASQSRTTAALQQLCFWTINLGVIIFFVFIIFDWFVPELVVAVVLVLSVALSFYLFVRDVPRAQQVVFLRSGMVFLVFTGLTGVAYILRYFVPTVAGYDQQLLMLHAFVSLYGWNLSGLLVIVRYNEFPIGLNSRYLILLHWITVMVLAPLGKSQPVFSLLATAGYTTLLAMAFFSRTLKEVRPA